MTYRELRRKLERLGSAVDLTGKPAGPKKYGSIQQTSGNPLFRGEQLIDWQLNPTNEREPPIPRHGNRDLAIGTLHRIRRNLGISRSDFDQA